MTQKIFQRIIYILVLTLLMSSEKILEIGLTHILFYLHSVFSFHRSDKKDINNVDSLVLMRDNFSMVTSYGVGPLPRPFLEASDSVILKVFGQTSQSLRRSWLGGRR